MLSRQLRDAPVRERQQLRFAPCQYAAAISFDLPPLSFLDGGGLRGARIEVRRTGRVAGTAVSDDAGAFRVSLAGSCAVYDISLRARTQGSTVTAATRRQLCPGDALPVDARVVTQGHFLWVPGPR